MFEVGMSALVLKICSEYAKSLGLNFPPCTQQEINAICEWVDKHAVKDMTISQDGYIVTFTFKGEYDTTKEFTITIPKNVNVDELEKVLVGSDSVVVERLENNSGLRVRLDQSVLNDINSKLTKPANPTAESAVTMLANGTVGTKPLSEIGGGGKLYRHDIVVLKNSSTNGLPEFSATVVIYSSISTPLTGSQLVNITGNTKTAIVNVETYNSKICNGVCTGYFVGELYFQFSGVIGYDDNTVEFRFGPPIVLDSTTDTVTEL